MNHVMSLLNLHKLFPGYWDCFAQRDVNANALMNHGCDWKWNQCHPNRMLIGCWHWWPAMKTTIGHPMTFLGWNNNYSRPHCADVNDAFVTMTTGVACDLCHHNYWLGSSDHLHYHHHHHQRPLCDRVWHFASRMTVNSIHSGCCHVAPAMNAFGDALAVVENAFDESILQNRRKID